VEIDANLLISEDKLEHIIAVDEALKRLARIDPRQSRLVELPFFAGLGVEEAAEVMGLFTVTIKREWAFRPCLALQGPGDREVWMTPDRWQQVKSIFDHAVECDPATREPVLLEQCGADEDPSGAVAAGQGSNCRPYTASSR